VSDLTPTELDHLRSAIGTGVPYSTAILAELPVYGPAFTTSDGVAMEWVADMATGECGYAQVA
jgi:hypothetical protein